MKRITKHVVVKILAISMLLFTCAVQLSFGASEKTQYIKVGLIGTVSSCVIKSDEGMVIAKAAFEGFEEILSLPELKQINIKVEAGRVLARDGAGEIVYDNIGSDICVFPLSKSGEMLTSGNVEMLKLNDKPYRGGICFYAAGNVVNIINYIELEDYVYGVLNSEMGYQNPAEALKAQAVTARSFAAANSNKHKSEGFDLCSTGHCQVYKGYSDEHTETNRAIEDTAGLLLMYDGKPVSGYYFKNSGGHTLSAADVWGGKAPYLTGVPDEYSPTYTWNYEITFQEAGRKLSAAGYEIGNLQSVTVKERNVSGAVSTVEFKGSGGSAELKSDKLRSVFGVDNIKSVMFTFDGSEIAAKSRDKANTGNENKNSQMQMSNGANAMVAGANIYIIGADGKTEKRSTADIHVFSNAENQPENVKQAESDTAERNKTVTNGPLVFYGAGFGHGVGMPQDSAIAMAKQGFKYDEILKYFFTNIDIR